MPRTLSFRGVPIAVVMTLRVAQGQVEGPAVSAWGSLPALSSGSSERRRRVPGHPFVNNRASSVALLPGRPARRRPWAARR